MKNSLRLAQMAQLHLVPVASVTVTRDELRDIGVEFEYGVDDLDEYAIAGFEVTGAGVFAVNHYSHAPVDNFDLLIDRNSASEPALSSMIKCVARELGLPGSSFSWVANGQKGRLAAETVSQHA